MKCLNSLALLVLPVLASFSKSLQTSSLIQGVRRWRTASRTILRRWRDMRTSSPTWRAFTEPKMIPSLLFILLSCVVFTSCSASSPAYSLRPVFTSSGNSATKPSWLVSKIQSNKRKHGPSSVEPSSTVTQRNRSLSFPLWVLLILLSIPFSLCLGWFLVVVPLLKGQDRDNLRMPGKAKF